MATTDRGHPTPTHPPTHCTHRTSAPQAPARPGGADARRAAARVSAHGARRQQRAQVRPELLAQRPAPGASRRRGAAPLGHQQALAGAPGRIASGPIAQIG